MSPGKDLDCGAYSTMNVKEAHTCEIRGLRDVHSFPVCKDIKAIQQHVGEWMRQRNMYGHGLDDMHLREMFVATLPEDLRSKIREKHEYLDLNQCIAVAQKSSR